MVALCHNASSGLVDRGSRVCMSVPFRDICHQALCQLIAVREVAESRAVCAGEWIRHR